MLENACAKKRRLDPLRSQRRNFGKMNGWQLCTDQWRLRGMIITASRNQRNRASVIAAVRISVNARVQLRRNTQEQRPEKRCGDEGRNKSPVAFFRTRKRAHCAASLSPARLSCKQISLPTSRGFFRSRQSYCEKRRDDYARKHCGLRQYGGHRARTHCSQRKAPNWRQPDRNRAVLNGASSPT